MPAKILVVEDNADSREMLITILESEGFSVVSAEDGQAGLKLVEIEHPDFIITDIEMPKLDGIGLIRELRENPDWINIPVLVLSAYGSGKLSEAMQAGANESMRKPAQLASILQLIKRLVAAGSSICLLICAGPAACMF